MVFGRAFTFGRHGKNERAEEFVFIHGDFVRVQRQLLVGHWDDSKPFSAIVKSCSSSASERRTLATWHSRIRKKITGKARCRSIHRIAWHNVYIDIDSFCEKKECYARDAPRSIKASVPRGRRSKSAYLVVRTGTTAGNDEERLPTCETA